MLAFVPYTSTSPLVFCVDTIFSFPARLGSGTVLFFSFYQEAMWFIYYMCLFFLIRKTQSDPSNTDTKSYPGFSMMASQLVLDARGINEISVNKIFMTARPSFSIFFLLTSPQVSFNNSFLCCLQSLAPSLSLSFSSQSQE